MLFMKEATAKTVRLKKMIAVNPQKSLKNVLSKSSGILKAYAKDALRKRT